MKRVLVRVYRDPHRLWSAEELYEPNLLGGNNGNYLFSDAVVASLSTPGVEVTCWTLEEMLAEVGTLDDRFDQLVLPFANAFRPGYVGYLHDYRTLLSQVQVPVTVLGIGAQSSLDYSIEPLEPLADEVSLFVRAVLEHSPSIGVRGEFTADYLRGLGFSEVEVIGCPSMFTFGPHLPEPSAPGPLGDDARIALNLTPHRPFPPGWLDLLVDRYPRLTYFPQSRKDLAMMMTGDSPDTFVAAPDGFPNRADHRLFTQAAAHYHLDSRTWVEDLAGFDFALGMRIHGNVAAILAGTPAHVVAHDSRTRELAEYFELPHTHLDKLGAEPDLDPLAAAQDGAMVRGHARRFATYADFLGRHALAHRWGPLGASESPEDWPRPQVLIVERGRPDDLTTRVAWLKSRHDREVRDLRRRLEEAHETVRRQVVATDRMRRRLDRQAVRLVRQGERLDRQAVRLDRLEAQVGRGARVARRLRGLLRRG